MRYFVREYPGQQYVLSPVGGEKRLKDRGEYLWQEYFNADRETNEERADEIIRAKHQIK